MLLQLVSVGAGDKGGHDSFYSLLYAGLFYEAMVNGDRVTCALGKDGEGLNGLKFWDVVQKDGTKAKKAMTTAAQTAYGSR